MFKLAKLYRVPPTTGPKVIHIVPVIYSCAPVGPFVMCTLHVKPNSVRCVCWWLATRERAAEHIVQHIYQVSSPSTIHHSTLLDSRHFLQLLKRKKKTSGPTKERVVDLWTNWEVARDSCIQDSVYAIIFKLPTQIAASCRHVSSWPLHVAERTRACGEVFNLQSTG